MSLTEQVLIAVLGILLFLWWLPKTKLAITHSKARTADWPSVILPLSVVAAFVILLIALLRND